MTRIGIELVSAALAGPRPGRAGQQPMIPRPRRGDIPPPPPDHPQKEAAVLILLYERRGELNFVLTRRTDSVALHRGQISLPGGAREDEEPLVETATRETFEELGISPDSIELLGPPLTPLFVPASGFWVTPFVGRCRGQPVFSPAPNEVLELIESPLSVLLDDGLVSEEEWEIRGEPVRVPFFQIKDHRVWGATAMILSEFKEMLSNQLSRWPQNRWSTED